MVCLGSAYVRGRSAEYWVKGLLEDQGYLVIRSAASHTPMDLLAARHGVRLAVQVKVKSRFTRDEREELLRWAKHFEAKPILATKKGGDGFSKRWLSYLRTCLG